MALDWGFLALAWAHWEGLTLTVTTIARNQNTEINMMTWSKMIPAPTR